MKVLHLVKTSTGAMWALRQMRELVRLGVEVHAAIPPQGPLVPEYERAGIAVHPMHLDFPIRRPWFCKGRFAALSTLVEELRPDILHSHHVGTTLTMRLALGRRCSVPRVFQVPGPLHLEHAFFRQAELLTAAPCDYWIGSCRWTCQRYLQSGISSDRVFLSYYGTDLDRFEPRAPGTLRAELGLADDTVVVGMVAYMYAPKRFLGQRRGLKGHEDLIDAVAICRREMPNMVCVMVGGPWNGAVGYERRIRAYATKRLDDRAVFFLGTRTDIPAIYADFNVVAHPSTSENVGGAAESLILGVPTVATHVGGFPDVVREGATGWLVPPRAPSRLAAAILDAVRHPERSLAMAKAGRAWTRDLFDVKRTAAEILGIYRTLLERSPESLRTGTQLSEVNRERVDSCR